MLTKHKSVMSWLSPIDEEVTELFSRAPSAGRPREAATYFSPGDPDSSGGAA